MNKINCIIFDWAGTTVDYGCFAPVAAFIAAFQEIQITVSATEARGPMGMTKIDHIRELFKLDSVSTQFSSNFSHQWSEDDVIEMNQKFEKHLFATLSNYTTPIDGVIDIIEALRKDGYKIGSTSGYTTAMMEVVAPAAAAAGYAPDCWVTSNNLPAGRPQPYMIYQNMINLAIESAAQVVKVGDTIADIREGVNAGVWSIGVVLGSSELGLSQEEVAALHEVELKRRIDKVRESMLAAGAHFVIDTMAELPELIQVIDNRYQGQKPLNRPYLLLTPGPLTSSDRVKRAMLSDWCTWDDDYNINIVQTIRRELLELAQVDPAIYTNVLLQGSGSYCVEAAVTNIVGADDKLLIIANGAYGERINKTAEYAKLNATAIILGETEQVTPELVKQALGNDPSITHVAVVHCETTTGILNPLAQIAQVVKDADKVFIVDAMSSFGGIPINMQQLGIDALISSANKCIQGVPGFGFIILRRDIMAKCKGRSRTLSLDIFDQWDQMEKGNGKWRFTSPTHVVRAFAEALSELRQEGGIEARYARYVENQRTLRQGMKEAGFQTLLPEDMQSPIITSFLYPDSQFNFKEFYGELKRCGFVLYPGKISQCDTFRIGNIGDVYPEDMLRLIDIVKSKSI